MVIVKVIDTVIVVEVAVLDGEVNTLSGVCTDVAEFAANIAKVVTVGGACTDVAEVAASNSKVVTVYGVNVYGVCTYATDVVG